MWLICRYNVAKSSGLIWIICRHNLTKKSNKSINPENRKNICDVMMSLLPCLCKILLHVICELTTLPGSAETTHRCSLASVEPQCGKNVKQREYSKWIDDEDKAAPPTHSQDPWLCQGMKQMANSSHTNCKLRQRQCWWASHYYEAFSLINGLC